MFGALEVVCTAYRALFTLHYITETGFFNIPLPPDQHHISYGGKGKGVNLHLKLSMAGAIGSKIKTSLLLTL